MQIRYIKGQGVVLAFVTSELQACLAVLRALYQISGQDFIARAIADIEKDLQLSTKQLPIVNHFHICQHCFRDLDDRDPNSFKMTTRSISGEEVVKWTHYVCDPLKPDSTRER